MKRKYSLAHLGYLSLTPPQLIYLAKGAGYDYASIRIILLGVKGEVNYDLSKNSELFALTKQAIEDTGIGIHDIELAKISDESNVLNYESAFEAAAKLNVHHVISSIWTDNEPFYLEQFAKLCDLAAQYHINVGLEPVSFASISTLKQALDIIRTVDRTNAKILMDTLHFHRSGVKLDEIKEAPKDLFDFAHICDAPREIPLEKEALIHTARDERLYVGEGGIDIADMAKCMRSDTVFSIELPHTQRIAELGHYEHARRCLESCKRYMKEHGVL
ncbi:hypothetical protein I3500192B8_02980 [Acidaminococcus intestini]